MWKEKIFSIGKILLQGQCQVCSSIAKLVLIQLSNILRGHTLHFCVAKNSNEQFMIMYINILFFL